MTVKEQTNQQRMSSRRTVHSKSSLNAHENPMRETICVREIEQIRKTRMKHVNK